MKIQVTATLVAVCSVVSGHYTIPDVSLSATATEAWKHVRITDNKYSNGPVTDIKSPLMTCYQSVLDTSSVETLEVSAGSNVFVHFKGPVSHPGPMNVYLAKAPEGSLATFNPTEEVFFKIYSDGPSVSGTGLSWPSQGRASIPIKIPACIEDGDYLLRAEHIGLHSAGSAGGAQLYISCAHIHVSGGSGTAQASLMAFPGAYEPSDPGLMVNIYYPVPTNYKAPGGEPLSC